MSVQLHTYYTRGKEATSALNPWFLDGAIIGDTHLWHTQWGKETRSVSLFRAFLNTVTHAIDSGIKLILLTGDTLNAIRPSPETMMQLKSVNRLLRIRGVLCLVISGNHDFTGPTHWISTIIDEERNELEACGFVMLDWKSMNLAPGLDVIGIPGVDAETIRERLPSLPDAALVMAHFTPKERMGFASERSLSIIEVLRPNTKLVALGDYHEPFIDIIDGPNGAITAAMPASTAHCAVSESDEKGYIKFQFQGEADGTGLTLLHTERVVVEGPDVLRLELTTEPDAIDRLQAKLATRDPEKELLLVVKFDATKDRIATVNTAIAGLKNITLISRPYVTAKDVTTGEITTSEVEIRPLAEYISEFKTGHQGLDGALQAVVERVPEADTLLEQAIADFVKEP